MNEIMIRCPVTGKELSTGIFSDPGSFALTSFFVSQVHCPICGVEHSWSKSDAWLKNEETELHQNEAGRLGSIIDTSF